MAFRNNKSNNFNNVGFGWNIKTLSRIFFVAIVMLWMYLISLIKFTSFNNPLLRGNISPSTMLSVNTKSGIDERLTANRNHNHVVIVAGHAVVKFSKLSVAPLDDSAWYLLPYQKNQGFPDIIFSHINAGIQLLNQDEKSILIFSGKK